MTICMYDKNIGISKIKNSMSKVVCVTNRLICNGDFLDRMEQIAKAKPKAIVLREKDMNREQYKILAKHVLEICNQYDTECILHSFADVSRELKCKAIHLPMAGLLTLSEKDRGYFTILGASCHSSEDAVKAEELGCSYIIAGHIFDTDCKKGLPGRGLEFLRGICESVKIPVYAIGGITSDNMTGVFRAGATGACVMSGLMKCENPQRYLNKYNLS